LELPEKPLLHLHAREVCFRHPVTNDIINVKAPVPPHFKKTLKLCNFDPSSNPKAELSDEEIERFFLPKKQTKSKKQKKTKAKTNKRNTSEKRSRAKKRQSKRK
jgi:hypothetical protein